MAAGDIVRALLVKRKAGFAEAEIVEKPQESFQCCARTGARDTLPFGEERVVTLDTRGRHNPRALLPLGSGGSVRGVIDAP